MPLCIYDKRTAADAQERCARGYGRAVVCYPNDAHLRRTERAEDGAPGVCVDELLVRAVLVDEVGGGGVVRGWWWICWRLEFVEDFCGEDFS